MITHTSFLDQSTPAKVGESLAERLRALRLLKGWTRETLAQRAGVSSASLKRFEVTGKISLESFLKLVHTLGRLEEFGALLQPPTAQSLDELEQRAIHLTRKRGRL